MVSSCHQLGVSYTQAFQVTHFSNSSIGGLGEGAFTFSSSELLAGPWRKQVTSGPNSGGSSKLRSSVASMSPSDTELFGKGGTWSREHSSPPATPGCVSSSVPEIYICGSPCFGNGLMPQTGSWWEGGSAILSLLLRWPPWPGPSGGSPSPWWDSYPQRHPSCISWGSCCLGVGLQLGWAPQSSVAFCPSPIPGILLRRPPPLLWVLALWEETQVASRVCILHSRGIQTPPYWSGTLPAGWWICLPWDPASAGHVGSLGGQYALPPSALALRHAETSCAVSQGNGGYLPPSSLALQE